MGIPTIPVGDLLRITRRHHLGQAKKQLKALWEAGSIGHTVIISNRMQAGEFDAIDLEHLIDTATVIDIEPTTCADGSTARRVVVCGLTADYEPARFALEMTRDAGWITEFSLLALGQHAERGDEA